MTNRLLALLPVLLASAVIAGCGSEEVAPTAVATVGDQTIRNTTFGHWLDVAAGQSAAQSGGRATIGRPPQFATCVAAKRKAAPRPARGQPAQTDDQLRTECEREYNSLRDAVLDFLIAARWVEGEAADQGVRVSDRDVQRAVDQVRRTSFPSQREFDNYLRQSGLTIQDVRYQTRVEQLQNKLVEKITRGSNEITDAQIQRYYDRNRNRLRQPERRDVDVILTRTEARASQARQAIDGGLGFRAAVRRFSQDDTTKQQNGRLPALTRDGGQLEKRLEDAVFAARRGVVSGPVRTQFGFYVFRVAQTTPATTQSLRQARSGIRQVLAQQNQERAVQRFIEAYRDKWSDETNCREGFVVGSCANATVEQRRADRQRQAAAQQQQQQQQQVPQQQQQQQGPPPQQQAPPPATGE
ncbi:MAG: peptidyl-prolyl cis-trans isomerase [Solirubrobacterales bacterium]|nr:peptidyl-prolyl cis-trans isomerase [Solirubrobacterales bacterium]